MVWNVQARHHDAIPLEKTRLIARLLQLRRLLQSGELGAIAAPAPQAVTPDDQVEMPQDNALSDSPNNPNRRQASFIIKFQSLHHSYKGLVTSLSKMKEVGSKIAVSSTRLSDGDRFLFVGRMATNLITQLVQLSHNPQ